MKFSDEVVLTDEFNNNTVEIFIRSADYSDEPDEEDEGDFDLTWEVEKISSDEIDIQLKLKSPI